MERILLSPNFYLDEFTHSDTAIRHGIDISVSVESVHFDRLKRLCETVLQPIRDALGPISITSGYRPPEVNKLVGGAPGSAHAYALAADFKVRKFTPYEVCQWIEESDLDFDQCIQEFDRWTHIALDYGPASKQRRQLLTAYKFTPAGTHRPVTRYMPGIHQSQSLQKGTPP